MIREPIPLFGTRTNSRSVRVTAQRRLNCYLESSGDDPEKGPFSIHGMPGLAPFLTVGTVNRGGISDIAGNRAFCVSDSRLFEVPASGAGINRGTLSTSTGRVSMASNGTQIMIVDGTAGYIYNMSTTAFATITDVDFPANPTTVTFHDGRFLVTFSGSGRFYGSAIYDGLSWVGTDFATAESNPDNNVAIHVSGGDVAVFGDETTEFWQNVGGSGFPYQRIQGATTDWGLAARHSVGRVGNTLMFLARRAGEAVVLRLDGYQAEVISDTDIAYKIALLSNISDATGFGYMHGGHAFYQLNFPTAGVSYLYDDVTGMWFDLQSNGLTRHVGEYAVRIGKNTIVADYRNGNLYTVDPTIVTENGLAPPFELVSRHMFTNDNTLSLAAIQVDFETGVGDQYGSDPQAMLAISYDGGHTYGTERWTSIGKLGEYTARAIWRRNGRSRDMTMRLRVTDPVKRVITGASAIMGVGLN